MNNIMILENQIKRRKAENCYGEKSIGSILKAKRLELNETLDAIAENVCSISYLSKIEQGQISIGDKYLVAISKRLKLKPEDIKPYDEFNQVAETILDGLIRNNTFDPCITSSSLHKIDYKSILIQFAHDLMFSDEKKISAINEIATHNMIYYSDFEMSFCLLMHSMYAFKKGFYEQSMQCLSFDVLFDCKHESIELLSMRQRLLNAFRMQRTLLITELYDTYLNRATVEQKFHLIEEMQYEYLVYQTHFWSMKKIELALSQKAMRKELKDYILARAFFNDGDYNSFYDVYQSYEKSEDVKWHVLYVLMRVHTNQRMQGTTLFDRIGSQENQNIRLFLEFMKVILLHDDPMIIEYVKDHMLGYKDLVDDFFLITQIVLSAQQVLSKHFLYKDASRLMLKFYERYLSLTGFRVSHSF